MIVYNIIRKPGQGPCFLYHLSLSVGRTPTKQARHSMEFSLEPSQARHSMEFSLEPLVLLGSAELAHLTLILDSDPDCLGSAELAHMTLILILTPTVWPHHTSEDPRKPAICWS